MSKIVPATLLMIASLIACHSKFNSEPLVQMRRMADAGSVCANCRVYDQDTHILYLHNSDELNAIAQSKEIPGLWADKYGAIHMDVELTVWFLGGEKTQ